MEEYMSRTERFILMGFSLYVLFLNPLFAYIILGVIFFYKEWEILTLLLEKLDSKSHYLHKIVLKIFRFFLVGYQNIKYTILFFLLFLTKRIVWFMFFISIVFIQFYDQIEGIDTFLRHVPILFNDGALSLILSKSIVSDNDLTYIFSFIFRSLWIFGPISITFYIFTYREQKGTAYSNVSTGGATKLLIGFLLSSVITVIYSYILSSRLTSYIESVQVQNNKTSDLFFLNKNLPQINVLLFLYFIAIILGIIVIIVLWRGISLESALKQSANKTKDTIRYISFIKVNLKFFEQSSREIFNNLHHAFETNYQLLLSAVDNNTNYLFNKYYRRLESNLYYLHSSPRIYYLLTEPRYMYLLRKDPKNYHRIYKSVLKNQLTLIKKLIEKNKMEEVDIAIRHFFSLSPGVFSLEKEYNNKKVEKYKKDYKEIVTIYFSLLYELSLLLRAGKFIGINKILKNMNQIEEEEDLVRKIDTIVIYRALIISAIEENDLKLLTETVNSIINNISNLNRVINKPESLTINGKTLVIRNEGIENKGSEYDEKVEGIPKNRFEEVIIYTILEGTLKR
jgi:hypothetical protein